jgi:hypothetical protein
MGCHALICCCCNEVSLGRLVCSDMSNAESSSPPSLVIDFDSFSWTDDGVGGGDRRGCF